MQRQAQPSVSIQNIATAFAGEAMVHIKYPYFAKVEERRTRCYQDALQRAEA